MPDTIPAVGMDAETGARLSGYDHLKQSIGDILATPLGSRVMRRDYGSRLPELMHAPMTPGLNVEIFAAVAEALATWEKRFRLTRVESVSAGPGQLTLSLRGDYLPLGKEILMEGVIVQ
ncbi:GPW/gp25 family protein [Desulfoluna spongiiphila]|uniref:GPW/gp25 family protein n=1 Tax=Desulfoluna spongiiphila TaxID=419481 RepID=UPI00125712FA|nr:GPW/gp25 family protein [Desulfoluna spongiiphila]VVS90708.1 gpw/gp25/anti-adapter protein irad [Desulfoluna spongiiphila]